MGSDNASLELLKGHSERIWEGTTELRDKVYAAAEEDEAAEAMEVVDDNRSGIGKSCFESTSTPPARLTPRISCIPSSSMRIVCTRDSKSLRFFLGGGAGPSLYARSAAGRCFSAISPRGPACGGLRPLMTTAPSSGGVARAER